MVLTYTAQLYSRSSSIIILYMILVYQCATILQYLAALYIYEHYPEIGVVQDEVYSTVA